MQGRSYFPKSCITEFSLFSEFIKIKIYQLYLFFKNTAQEGGHLQRVHLPLWTIFQIAHWSKAFLISNDTIVSKMCLMGWFPIHLDSGCFSCCFYLNKHSSVSFAFPLVGWQRSKAANTKWPCMPKYSGDFIASQAFHIPEAGIRALHQVLLLEFPLPFWRRMKAILFERHVLMERPSSPKA